MHCLDRCRHYGRTRADALRAELEGAGWLVEDSAEGTRIRRR